MITISSSRPIAFVDVDGVIVANPEAAMMKQTITDGTFWTGHWSRPMEAALNDEMYALVQSLISTGWHVIFLTARPEKWRPETVTVLKRAGFLVKEDEGNSIHLHPSRVRAGLIMLPGEDIPLSSAEWKQSIVREALSKGGEVKLMIEDYRPNAEAIRPLVPVLLYERKKISEVLPMLPCCGGLSRCWCPIGGPRNEHVQPL